VGDRSTPGLRRGSTASAGRPADAAALALFAEAGRVAANAYAPYSGYGVGAALVAESGRVHLGVNVENAAYPAGLCAERAALAAAATAGERDLRTVAVAAASGADCVPCGLCLQALAEFGDPDVVARIGGDVRVLRLSDLLTAPFAAGGAAWGSGEETA
jgi:cytidine deaminase